MNVYWKWLFLLKVVKGFIKEQFDTSESTHFTANHSNSIKLNDTDSDIESSKTSMESGNTTIGKNYSSSWTSYYSDDQVTTEAGRKYDVIDPDTCKVVPVRHFLKIKCKDGNNETYFKCTHGSGSYRIKYESEGQNKILNFGEVIMFDEICDQDPGFYQICGHQRHKAHIGQYGMLCGDLICRGKFRGVSQNQRSGDWYSINNHDIICNGQEDCLNTAIDEEKCDPRTEFDCKLYHAVKEEFVSQDCLCNDICDCSNCADEALTKDNSSRCTSSQPIGMFCEKTFKLKRYGMIGSVTKEVYIEPHMICDQTKHCNNGADEKNCAIYEDKDQESCDYSYRSRVELLVQKRPLLSRQKCSVPNVNSLFYRNKPICRDLSDQFNCPDESKNALECHTVFEAGPKLTNLSRYLVDCKFRDILLWSIQENSNLWDLPFVNHITGRLSFCNDSIDGECLYLEGRYNTYDCAVHKHKMCDNNTDCPINRQDEMSDICKDMEDKKCVRRVGGVNWFIPSKWVGDGIADCVDGVDEDEEFWKKRRFCSDRSGNCLDEMFYFCSHSENEKLSFKKLCDRVPSCSSEERVCRVARNQDIFWTKPVTSSGNFQRSALSYCLPGLENLTSLENGCKEAEVDQVYNVLTERATLIPNKTVDCSFLFGVPYLTTACNGMCTDKNLTCKLTRLKHDSCKNNIADKNRIYTVATMENGNPYVTLVRKVGSLGSKFIALKFFECTNGACIDNDKVCNLANDCGDWSDENGCSNQFPCKATGDRISWNRYCDGKFDCSDHSDECGGDCHHSHEVINGTFLIGCSWCLGLLATILNLIAITTTSCQIFRESSAIKIINLMMVVLIGFGDLCVGAYLVTISVVNYQYRHADSTYCQDYYNWLTSDACSILGILNTFGSQLSLYSMTLLSMFRVFCLKNSGLRGSIAWKGKTSATLVCSSMILFAASISFIPMLPQQEDYFVNGLAYFNNPMFIGFYDKSKHLAILKEYYGKFKAQNLSWKQIKEMVSNMFSRFNDSSVVGSKVNFYGNSGVCLFKFFVRENDPQRGFTWFVIIQNALCFFIITISYTLIHMTVENSAKRLSRGTIKNMSTASGSQKKQSNKNSTLNRKITLMVLTDFLCWVPFIVVCSLHYFEVIDATEWYSLFSIIILPLNSVINPLLYDNSGLLDFIGKLFLESCRKIGILECLNNFTESSKAKIETPAQPISPEPVELENIRSESDNAIQEHPDTVKF